MYSGFQEINVIRQFLAAKKVFAIWPKESKNKSKNKSGDINILDGQVIYMLIAQFIIV